MTGLGSTPPRRAFWRRVGLDGDFGRGSRGAKGTLLGRPFLVAQPGFEANNFFLQPVNDQLLFQTLWAIGQLEFRRVLVWRWGVTLLAVLAQKFRAQLVEELFQGLAVAQGLLQLWD